MKTVESLGTYVSSTASAQGTWKEYGLPFLKDHEDLDLRTLLPHPDILDLLLI